MDIKVHPQMQHWQFIIRKAEDGAGITAEIGFFSASAAYTPAKQQRLKKELAKILEISPDTVQIREKPSIFADICANLEEDMLQTIDLKV